MNRGERDRWFAKEILTLEPIFTRFLQRNWRNKADIDDLRQETYARVFEAACREVPQQIKPFLFRVARNLMIDRVRQQKVVCIETMEDLGWSGIPSDEPSPEMHVSARQELRILQAALDELSPRCRQVIVLRKVEGLSQKEVASHLQISEDTVEREVAKAIRVLSIATSGRRCALMADARRYCDMKELAAT